MSFQDICTVIIDEAHCIAQWGGNFHTAYSKIRKLCAFFPPCQGTSLWSYPTPPSLCIAPPVYQFTIIQPLYAIAYTYSTITDSFRLGRPHYELITEHVAYLWYIRFMPEYY